MLAGDGHDVGDPVGALPPSAEIMPVSPDHPDRAPRPPFSVQLDLIEGEVVIRLGGALDVVTACEVERIAAAVCAQGHCRVVLDLDGLCDTDVHGLRVISRAAASVARSGGELTMRSPPPFTVRLLELCGLAETCLELREVTAAPGADERRWAPVRDLSPDARAAG